MSETTVARHHDPALADGLRADRRRPDRVHPLVIETEHSRFPVHRRRTRTTSSASCSPRSCCTTTPTPDAFNMRDTAAPRGVRARVEAPQHPAQASSAPTATTSRSSSTNTAACPASSRSRTCSSRSSATSRTSTIRRGNHEHHPAAGQRALPRRGADADRRLSTSASAARSTDDEFDTVGGMVASAFGRLPQPGEEIALGGFLFRVTKGDARRVQQFAVRIHEA